MRWSHLAYTFSYSMFPLEKMTVPLLLGLPGSASSHLILHDILSGSTNRHLNDNVVHWGPLQEVKSRPSSSLHHSDCEMLDVDVTSINGDVDPSEKAVMGLSVVGSHFWG